MLNKQTSLKLTKAIKAPAGKKRIFFNKLSSALIRSDYRSAFRQILSRGKPAVNAFQSIVKKIVQNEVVRFEFCYLIIIFMKVDEYG